MKRKLSVIIIFFMILLLSGCKIRGEIKNFNLNQNKVSFTVDYHNFPFDKDLEFMVKVEHLSSTDQFNEYGLSETLISKGTTINIAKLNPGDYRITLFYRKYENVSGGIELKRVDTILKTIDFTVDE